MIAVPNLGNVVVPERILPPVIVAKITEEVPWAVALKIADGEKLTGILSKNVAFVAVLGPALVTTNEKVTVCPTEGFAIETDFDIARSVTAVTPRVEVAANVFEPTLVLSEPEGMVLVNVPASTVVTTTDMEQAELGGIKAPAANVTEFEPTVAVTEPAPPTIQVVVCAGVV